MSSNGQAPIWDEEVDFRRWIEVIYRGKLIIVTLLLASLAIGLIVNFLLWSPTYESTGVIALPDATIDPVLGFTLLDYREFGLNDTMLDRIAGNSSLTTVQPLLANQYRFQLDTNRRALTVTASAGAEPEAARLATTWIEAYRQELPAELQRRFAAKKEQREQQVATLGQELEIAERDYETFTVATPLEAMQTQLTALEHDLTSEERNLRQLNRLTIPENELELALLEDKLSRLSSAQGSGPGNLAVTETSDDEGLLSEELAARDPYYLQLRQSLAQARLEAIEEELVNNESRLRQLNLYVFRASQARVASLEEALESLSLVVENYPGQNGGAQINATPTINASYLRLSEELENARIQLSVDRTESEALAEGITVLRSEAESLRHELVDTSNRIDQLESRLSLEQRIQDLRQQLDRYQREADSVSDLLPSLRQEIRQLEEDIVRARATTEQLSEAITRTSASYDSESANLTSLLELEPNLGSLTSISTLRAPLPPLSSVEDRRVRNVIFSGMLGLFLGVATVLLLELFRNWRAHAPAPQEEEGSPTNVSVSQGH